MSFPQPKCFRTFAVWKHFFDLSLPKSWADLSDPQLLFFFRQLATDKTMDIKIKSKQEATSSKKNYYLCH